MTTRTTYDNTDGHSSTDELRPVAEAAEATERYEKSLKSIRNNIEQLHEINQSISAISQEIVDEITKVLQLNNTILQLEGLEDFEATVYPNGLALIRGADGKNDLRSLSDFRPAFLCEVLKQLIPKLKESLDDRKREGENLLGELTKTHESLV